MVPKLLFRAKFLDPTEGQICPASSEWMQAFCLGGEILKQSAAPRWTQCKDSQSSKSCGRLQRGRWGRRPLETCLAEGTLLTARARLQKESLLITSIKKLLGISSGPECWHSSAQQPCQHKDSPYMINHNAQCVRPFFFQNYIERSNCRELNKFRSKPSFSQTVWPLLLGLCANLCARSALQTYSYSFWTAPSYHSPPWAPNR